MTDATPIASASEIRDNARGIMQMCAFAAWKARIDGQIEGRKLEALNPIKGELAKDERNYQNGETAGLMAAVKMWELLIEEMDTEINRITQQGEPDVEA